MLLLRHVWQINLTQKWFLPLFGGAVLLLFSHRVRSPFGNDGDVVTLATEVRGGRSGVVPATIDNQRHRHTFHWNYVDFS